MTVKKIFKSTVDATQYIFANGKAAYFVGGRYVTDVPYEVAELTGEIQIEGHGKSLHPIFYIDTIDKEIDTTLQDKIKAAQAEALVKVMAEEVSLPVIIGAGDAAAANSASILAALSTRVAT